MNKEFNRFMSAEVVSITPSGRSGSYFVQSLLDGHEAIVTIPFHVSIFGIFDEIKGLIKKRDNTTNIKSIVSYVCDKSSIQYFFHDDSRFWDGIKVLIKDKKEPIKINKKRFSDELAGILRVLPVINRKNFYYAIHYAWAKTNNIDIKKVKYIVDQTHAVENLKKLYKVNKNLKLLHTVRDPRASYYSYLEMNKHNNKGMDNYSIDIILMTYRFIFFSMGTVKDWKKILNRGNYHLVSLEDIHNRFNDVVRGIAKWLEIKLTKSLFKSTMNGHVWEMMSYTHKKNIKGVNKKSTIPKWQEKLSREEIIRVEYLSRNFMKQYGYKTVYWKGKGPLLIAIKCLWKPFKRIQIFHKHQSLFTMLVRIKQFINLRLKLLYYIIKY